MSKKKDAARKAVNKKTRKVSDKVRGDECPNNVCPLDKKKKKTKDTKVSEASRNCWGSFLDFVFPSRTKNV